MKKLTALLLAVFMILACCSVFAVAEDEEVRIGVYKIDPLYYYEGVVAIYTPARGEVLGIEGQNFAWWTVLVFEADEATGGYKCISTHAGDGTDKTNIAIPANGFIICANAGNNWPALFETANGSEWFYNDSNDEGIPYSECPDFTSDHVNADINTMKSVSVGDIFYLSGISLDNSNILTNEDGEEIFWYSDNFETSAYLTSVKPDDSVIDDEPLDIDTTGWTYVDGETNGTWQTPIPTEENPDNTGVNVGSFYYNITAADGKYVVEVLFNGKLSGTADSFGNGAGTNVRVWFHSAKNAAGEDQLCYNAIMDIAYTGDGVKYRIMPNTVATGNSADSSTYGYDVEKPFMTVDYQASANALYVKAVLSEIPNVVDDGNVTAIVTVSNKPDGTNNALHAASGDSAAPWADAAWADTSALAQVPTIVAPSEQPSEQPSETPTQPTSDNGIAAFAVISVLAVAGAVIVKKSR